MKSDEAIGRVLDRLEMSPSGGALVTRRIDALGRFRVAQVAEDHYVLVIQAERSLEATDVRLPHLRARVNASVLISDEHGGQSFENACIVEVNGPLGFTREAFAAVVAAVVDALGPTGAASGVPEVVDALVRLFAPAGAPRGSVLGLWGELVLILESPEPQRLLEAWHADPLQLHDFAVPGRRLEVKTTQGALRAHHFGRRQLQTPTGLDLHVVSIVTTRTDSGSSVRDLADELLLALAEVAGARLKLLDIIRSTLGGNWLVDWEQLAWDGAEARSSMRVIPARVLPELGQLDPRILDVDMLIDCDGLGSAIEPTWLTNWALGADRSADS